MLKSNIIPFILYKYRDWSDTYHKRIIEEQEFYYASPKKFNDPYDCAITVNYYKMIKDNDYLRSIINDDDGLRNLSENEKQKRISYAMNDNPLNTVEGIKANKLDQIQNNQNNFGVITLAGKSNIDLMWAHYACSHKGFCIGIHTNKLVQYLQSIDLFGIIDEVRYKDSLPEILPVLSENDDEFKKFLIDGYFTKQKSWIYENEYRILKIYAANKPVKVPKDVFAEVILGANISEDHEAQILESVAKHLPDVKLSKAKIDRDSYAVLIEPFKGIGF